MVIDHQKFRNGAASPQDITDFHRQGGFQITFAVAGDAACRQQRMPDENRAGGRLVAALLLDSNFSPGGLHVAGRQVRVELVLIYDFLVLNFNNMYSGQTPTSPVTRKIAPKIPKITPRTPLTVPPRLRKSKITPSNTRAIRSQLASLTLNIVSSP
jgi:hypothetical protein